MLSLLSTVGITAPVFLVAVDVVVCPADLLLFCQLEFDPEKEEIRQRQLMHSTPQRRRGPRLQSQRARRGAGV